MILDTLDNIQKYSFINPLMKQIVDFLTKTDLSSLEPGKIVIDGDKLFVNVSNQSPKSRKEVPLESHTEYIDIQIPISADEEMGFTPQPLMPFPSIEYDPKADITFYPGFSDSYINVRKGMFVVFFPGEGHAPAITANGVFKLIIKMRK